MDKDYPQDIKDILLPSGSSFLFSLEDRCTGHLVEDSMSWKDLLVALDNEKNKGERVIYLFTPEEYDTLPQVPIVDDSGMFDLISHEVLPKQWVQLEGEYETRFLWTKTGHSLIEESTILTVLPDHPIIYKYEKQLAEIDTKKLHWGYKVFDGKVMKVFNKGSVRLIDCWCEYFWYIR
jgi:hypothetical protein